jgi:hypothetical protein
VCSSARNPRDIVCDYKKAMILEDASIMALFTLPDEQLVSQEVKNISSCVNARSSRSYKFVLHPQCLARQLYSLIL